MQNSNPHKPFFMQSVEGLAKVIAWIAAFLLTPPVYNFSVGWVETYAARYYGSGIESLASLVWFILTACLIYQFSKATIGTALMLGGVGIMLRLMA
jgi:hypothetical protein